MNWTQFSAASSDAVMCGLMNLLQWKLRHEICGRDEFIEYLDRCAQQSREEFYAVPEGVIFNQTERRLCWSSPVASGFAENDQACADLFLQSQNPNAPTVLILHALMSANANGYQRVAAWFNARGWNAALLHLPYHYSRIPRGYVNGSQAVSANLIRNGETLRQGVTEVRQLMQWFRERGSGGFGLIGTSFGGWVGALVSFLEKDFHFLSLIQPIANVDHALWKNPSARMMRRLLLNAGITPEMACRHEHLSSPLHGQPLCGGERVLIGAGIYDTVSPRSELQKLAQTWSGAELLESNQGHFGYAALRDMLKAIERRWDRGEFL